MIELKEIEKTFGKSDAAVHALRGVNLHIAQGEMLAIMGKSGSGKSTLLNIIGGLIAPDAGEYRYCGAPIDFHVQKNLLRFRRNTVGVILQHFALLDDMTVRDNVMLALRHSKLSRKQQLQRTLELLQLLEIEDKATAYPLQLSGGQQQRVAIARAMVKQPDILLADEPTGALDEETEKTVLEILKKIHSMGKTIIIVTHDESVAKICERIIVLKDGTVQDNSTQPSAGLPQ